MMPSVARSAVRRRHNATWRSVVGSPFTHNLPGGIRVVVLSSGASAHPCVATSALAAIIYLPCAAWGAR
jgi:hypothetical protein